MIRFARSAAVATLMMISTARADVPITECGQTIAFETGNLTADLDCSNHAGSALTVRYGTVNLNGFTLTGNAATDTTERGVPVINCDPVCRVHGPGTVTGGSGGTFGGGQCCTDGAIAGVRVKAIDVTVEGNEGSGIAGAYLRLKRTTVRNNAGYGVVHNFRANIMDSVIANNDLQGLQGFNAIGGLTMGRTQVTDNSGIGISATGSGVTLRDVVVTGNATGDCQGPVFYYDSTECVDLLVTKGAKLSRVECGTSHDATADAPTGLCTND